MIVSILRMPNAASSTDLIAQFLRLRRKVFIEEMGWGLQTYHDFETEDYDAFKFAHYIIAHEKNEVIAGARLLRCDTSFDINGAQRSYMIRDAVKGRINLPTNLMSDEPPTDSKTWELTRLVSKGPNLNGSKAVMKVSYEYMKLSGAKRVLLLARPAIMRFVRINGYHPKPIGPIIKNESGSFLAFACDIH